VNTNLLKNDVKEMPNISPLQPAVPVTMVRLLHTDNHSDAYHRNGKAMDKLQKLELIDKIQRELKDLEQSQTAVLKKVSQIAAHNITLGAEILDQKLPDIQETIDANVLAISGISEAFEVYRDKFFNDNKMGAQLDPTA
jgi:oligoribonuclease (3'-5' exoribonuclease)